MIGRIILFSIFCTSLFGQNLIVQNEPVKPLINQTFKLIFKFQTIEAQNLEIEFNPSNLRVLRRVNKTRPGLLHVEYDVLGEKSGTYEIADITLYNNQTKQEAFFNKHAIQVLEKMEKKPPLFLEAIPEKTSIYLNEGVRVKYYLYSKGIVRNYEVIRFPKFNNFQKRFNKRIVETPEQVIVGNEVYTRSLKYDVVLFPNKVGKLKLDSFELKVLHMNTRSRLNFGQAIESKRTVSDPVFLEILPLPDQLEPQFKFTGLIGVHNMRTQLSAYSTTTNKPITITASVSGKGYLEQLDLRDLFNDADMEILDSQMELKISTLDQGTKTFSWTVLMNNPGRFENLSKVLTIFDRDTESYEKINIDIPTINVTGKARKIEGDNADIATNMTPIEFKLDKNKYLLTIDKPQLFSFYKLSIILIWIFNLIYLLLFAKSYFYKPSNNDLERYLKRLSRGGLNYRDFYLFLQTLREDKIKKGKSVDLKAYIISYIKKENLEGDEKKYFQQLLQMLENSEYHESKTAQFQEKFKMKYFKKLISTGLNSKESSSTRAS